MIRFACPSCKQVNDMPIRSVLWIKEMEDGANPFLLCTGCKKKNPVDFITFSE
jgi:hypothetical protein